MGKRRILQLIASSHGGGATHLLDLVTMLPKELYDVMVAMPEDGGNVSRQAIEGAGATFLSLDIRSGLKFGELRKMRAILQNGRFDIIHIHGARAGLYGRLAALTLRHRPTIIFSIHGFATPYYTTPKRQIYLMIERVLQRITQHTICVAQAEADLFLSFGLTQKEKTSVINPGIPLERFQKEHVDTSPLKAELSITNQPIILTICRLHIPRDFETLLTAVSQLISTYPTLQLLIVGDGPMRPQIEARINTLTLQNHVRLLGFRQDIPELLTLADIYTLTSDGWEGFPISTLEAQAMGCPVVVSDAGGAAEAVLHQQTGLVVPKQHAPALAKALQRLLQDHPLREKLGQQGKQRAKQAFSTQDMIKKISQLYQGK